jgi:hypothetical protein
MSKPENNERENFLTRWSSRKFATRTPPTQQDAERAPHDAEGTVDNGAVAKTGKEDVAQDDLPFDITQLPPLDSIGPDTDIAAFLRKEVPPDLTRAALRRAWTSDPAIKNFVGLVENGWDFNDPSAMAGFGAISAEEVARLAGKVLEALPEAAPEDQTKAASASEKKSYQASTNALLAGPLEDTTTTESGRGAGHEDYDAAQQSETGNKGRA